MLYEYALISVLIASGYWGIWFLRKQPHGTATFGLMQLAAAVLSGLGLLGRTYADVAWLGVAGAIGVGAGVCLLIVGPLVRGLARRFAALERLGIATRLLDLAEMLAPGSGIAEEKAVLGAMREIRDGRIEETVDALTAAKHRAPPEARLAIDERIALLYLAAYRWGDAIAHAEAHLFGATGAPAADASTPTTDRADAPAVPASKPGSLRQALGVAPPVWVELLGAYGRTGNLDQAARMLARLEDVCADREDAAIWIHRARLMFLALAGRPAAVRQLLAPGYARHMTVAARTYWVAVAHEHHGDRAAASAAYAKARTRSRGRPRELIDQALARLAEVEPTQLSPIASEVVARVEAAPLPAPVPVARPVAPWATYTLTAVLLAVASVLALAFGPTSDLGVLVRGGAMVRNLVEGGEWWRLVTCVFIHVGAVHLAVNVIGLYFLGRLVEELFGTARTLAVFAVAGLAGSVASYAASPAGISAGASGAIFGLLGAVFIELTWHRHKYRAAWKRGMWGGLVVVTVAQLGIGLLYPMIDQWAHGIGLAAGIVAGALLSPSARWAGASRHLARVIGAAFVALAIVASVLVARTTVADSLGATDPVRHVVGNVAITAPATWVNHGELADPDGLVMVLVQQEPLVDIMGQMTRWIARVQATGKARGFEEVVAATDRVLVLPDGWEGTERIGSFEDGTGNRQRFRLIIAGRAFGDTLVQLVIITPESIARSARAFFVELIASAKPA